MLGRGIMAASVATYLMVLGCVMWPAAAPAEKPTGPASARAATNAPLTGLPYRGVAIQIQRVDWIPEYKKSIDEIAALGADTVSLVVDTRQENGTASRIYLDMRMTPTPDQLGEIIDHAKKKNLRVVLMPIVLLDNPKGNEWRGTLKPESWDDWFDSYRQMINHFAWIAEAHGVNVLVIGSELVSSESKLTEWLRTISEIRSIFKGQLTYSSNWDHYTSIGFWDQLDLVGMNSYWKLGKDRNVTVPQVQTHWRDIQKDLLDFLKKADKPLLFLEVGWCSLANAAHEPWDYTKVNEDVDVKLQRRLYEGFFQSWHGNPSLGGFMIWEWPPDQGGLDNRGYTPKGKPAESVLREWLAKPRWEVK